jgi:hypothetical protein
MARIAALDAGRLLRTTAARWESTTVPNSPERGRRSA